MNNPEKLNQNTNSHYRIFVGLLCVLLISIMTHNIDRPFTGLHSWGQAHEHWISRAHVNYGLGYTKGFMTWAVGNPPAENPSRYLDHPQLSLLVDAAFMSVLGIHDWSLRVVNIATTLVTLLLLLKILRGLLEERTTLLAGLLFALFPLNGYFGVGMWMYPLVFLSIWCYMILIGVLRDSPQPGRLHKFGLAIGLFLALQMSWEGFFFAMAIGVHYVFRCIHRKQLPNKTLLTILIIAPLSSLALIFITLAAGKGWDFARLFEVYKWRAGSGELQKHDWGKWFARLWEFSVTNFSLPVMI
ncbi:MAG: glycosyltransferase family 39 protein, partial [Planctomycetes bacterium]|nr:glycosyltransferase family 39 protein [Planctomycetota bacterium]